MRYSIYACHSAPSAIELRRQRKVTDLQANDYVSSRKGGDTLAVAPEPEHVCAANEVVLCAIPVIPKGKRVAEHQPGYGDQAGDGKGLNAGGCAILEAGEPTCKSNTDEFRKQRRAAGACERQRWVPGARPARFALPQHLSQLNRRSRIGKLALATHVRRMARPGLGARARSPARAQRPHHCEGCGGPRVHASKKRPRERPATVKEHDARKRHEQDKGAADDDEGGVARVSTPIISRSLGGWHGFPMMGFGGGKAATRGNLYFILPTEMWSQLATSEGASCV
jgi:hypothetical protein